MTFEELLKQFSGSGKPNVCIDSRLVKTGDIFVAIKGTNSDGLSFIEKALAAGAKYIVTDRSYKTENAQVILVENTSLAAGLLAQAYWGNPSAKLTALAVTGTNGKTTVGFIVRSAMRSAGFKCGLIGTVVYDTGEGLYESTLTTPDGLEVSKLQAKMVESGVKYMVTEASSHALSQNRLAGINFKTAAFTNLTGNHLDYHKTEKEYLSAKTVLFQNLSPDATAVLNKQSPASFEIAKKTKAKILWYAIDEPADLRANIKSMSTAGTEFDLEYRGETQNVVTPLLGLHNVSNLLAAAGLCLGAGFDLKTTAKGIASLKNVPGRLEKVDWKGDFSVLIDYAHTDDALKNVLTTLKPLCKGKLIVVFGCGGDRDKTKRPRMAKVAEELADSVIVTSDNPRTEEPGTIIREIVAGFGNSTSGRIAVEADRRKAIELAVKSAGKGDILLIAGKGHENYQIIGKKKIHFSDKEIAEELLKK